MWSLLTPTKPECAGYEIVTRLSGLLEKRAQRAWSVTDGPQARGPLEIGTAGVVSFTHRQRDAPSLLTQPALFVMNRTVIVVKDATYKSRPVYRVVRLHWEYGQDVENWLLDNYATTETALVLIWRGHRSTRTESYRDLGQAAEHMTFTRLRDAKAWCEYLTLAYHDGKKWRFTHVDR